MQAPPPLPAAASDDLGQLRLLAIFHYVAAGLTALFSMFPLLHLAVGIGLVSGRLGARDPDAALGGWFFIAIAGVLILTGLTLAALLALGGRSLSRRRHYTFCLVVAGVACLLMPHGTILGVFTLVVLLRPGVKAWFDPSARP